MDFADVVRRRRMVRHFSDAPVAPESIERMLHNATRAPNAGFAQGWAFLVLERAADVDLFWDVTSPPARAAAPGEWLRGMRTAPVVIIVLTSKSAYLERYGEDDKRAARAASEVDPADVEARWPVPFWHVDAGMAALLMLQTAVDEGLGACFFGVTPGRVGQFRAAFGVPDEFTPTGAIALGHEHPEARAGGSPRSRPRKRAEDLVHRGRWASTDQ